jgi:hypothetical protein
VAHNTVWKQHGHGAIYTHQGHCPIFKHAKYTHRTEFILLDEMTGSVIPEEWFDIADEAD